MGPAHKGTGNGLVSQLAFILAGGCKDSLFREHVGTGSTYITMWGQWGQYGKATESQTPGEVNS